MLLLSLLLNPGRARFKSVAATGPFAVAAATRLPLPLPVRRPDLAGGGGRLHAACGCSFAFDFLLAAFKLPPSACTQTPAYTGITTTVWTGRQRLARDSWRDPPRLVLTIFCSWAD